MGLFVSKKNPCLDIQTMLKLILQTNKVYMKYKKLRYRLLNKQLEELTELLKKNGMKQKWVAEQLGVHRNQVARWIKGINEPSIENYKKIRKIIKSLKGVKWNLAE